MGASANLYPNDRLSYCLFWQVDRAHALPPCTPNPKPPASLTPALATCVSERTHTSIWYHWSKNECTCVQEEFCRLGGPASATALLLWCGANEPPAPAAGKDDFHLEARATFVSESVPCRPVCGVLRYCQAELP